MDCWEGLEWMMDGFETVLQCQQPLHTMVLYIVLPLVCFKENWAWPSTLAVLGLKLVGEVIEAGGVASTSSI
jgi:hypothetical protein